MKKNHLNFFFFQKIEKKNKINISLKHPLSKLRLFLYFENEIEF